MDSSSAGHHPVHFKLTLMLTGPAAPMTENSPVVFASFWVPTLSLGPLASIAPLSALTLNLNIAPLPSPPLNSYGSNPYFVTLVYFFPIPLHSGATILAPPIYLPILHSMPAQNTLKSTSSLSAIKLPPTL
jgi:hypothetical protein